MDPNWNWAADDSDLEAKNSGIILGGNSSIYLICSVNELNGLNEFL